MKILLLQNSVYFPSFGGGNKANRLLLEQLADMDHECWSISKSVNAQMVIDKTPEEQLLQERGIISHQVEEGCLAYDYRKVHVTTINTTIPGKMAEHVRQHYSKRQPDILLVSDDKQGELLALALELAPESTVLVLHTNLHLPFGKEATTVSSSRKQSFLQCKNILTSTRYTQAYLQKEAGISSIYLPFPVYGDGPFDNIARHNQGYIGMINPCAVKGIDIFVGLAEHFPNLHFAAVPTWGASTADMDRLTRLNNIKLLPPEDNIANIFRQMRILIVPSLIPETFGYVAVEAMLRGIPVLASDLGGLRDAKLGVDYLLPIKPAINKGEKHTIPTQDLAPWITALETLTRNHHIYEQCSNQSHHAAQEHVSRISPASFEAYFSKVGQP